MTKNELKTLKMNILGGMNEYILNLNDEDAIEPWLMCGVPDGATEDDLEYIAEDYEEWVDIVNLFARIVKKYVSSADDEYTKD